MEKLFTTFEQACALRGYDPLTVVPDVSKMPGHLQKATIAVAKLFVLHEAANLISEDGKSEVWIPDWNDSNQYKYLPWWHLKKDRSNKSGFRFGNANYDCTLSVVGSRLCSRNAEIAEFLATDYESLYRDLMVM